MARQTGEESIAKSDNQSIATEKPRQSASKAGEALALAGAREVEHSIRDIVFEDFLALADKPETARVPFLKQLSPERRAALARRAGAFAQTPPHLLDGLFDNTPDEETETLRVLTEARFGKKLDAHHWKVEKRREKPTFVPPPMIAFREKGDGQQGAGPDGGPSTLSGGEDWSSEGLRRLYHTMLLLPEGHVKNNPAAQTIRLNTGRDPVFGGHAGSFDEETQLIELGYRSTELSNVGIKKDSVGLNRNDFDWTCRHEIGHAVDTKMGAARRYCATKAGGGWRKIGTAELAQTLVDQGGGPEVDDATREQFVRFLRDEIVNPGIIDDRLSAMPWWRALAAPVQKSIRNCPAMTVVSTHRAICAPWNSADSQFAIGGRFYQESYSGGWTSYDVSARERMVSSYQFRAPEEWFAEAYAAYYAPPEAGETKGHLLRKVDPATAAWFDREVDKVA